MKVIDITEKLNFAEKPKIKIKDVEITVNNRAVYILKLMPKLNKANVSLDDIMDTINELVSEEDIKKLESLDLSFEDFITFFKSAIELITGDIEGEVLTRTTT